MTSTLDLRSRSTLILLALGILCLPAVPFFLPAGCPQLQAKPVVKAKPVAMPVAAHLSDEPVTNQCGCGGWIAQLCPACYSQSQCAIPTEAVLDPSSVSSPDGVDDNCMCRQVDNLVVRDEEVILIGQWNNSDQPDYTQPDWSSFDHPTFHLWHWHKSLSASNNDFAGPRNDLYDTSVSVIVKVRYIDGTTEDFDVSPERSCVYDLTPVNVDNPKAQISYWQVSIALPQPADLIYLFTSIETLEGECLVGDWKVFVTN